MSLQNCVSYEKPTDGITPGDKWCLLFVWFFASAAGEYENNFTIKPKDVPRVVLELRGIWLAGVLGR